MTAKEDFSIFIIFSDTHTCIYVVQNFELILIKIEFLLILNLLKNTMGYSTGSLAKFHQKWLRENSPFLYFFLVHIHVLMLCRKF